MKILKKILKILFSVILFFIILISGLLFSIFKWPEIIINSKNINKYKYLTHYIGWDVDWKLSDIQIISHSLLHKEIDFNWTNFCFSSGSNYKGCFNKIRLKGEMKWEKGLKIIRLGPILFLGGEIQVKIEKKMPEKDKEIFLNPPKIVLPTFLNKTKFFDSEIKLDKFVVQQEENQYEGDLDVVVHASRDDKLEDIALQGKLSNKDFLIQALNLKLMSTSHFSQEDWKLLGEAKIEKSPIENVSSKFEIFQIDSKNYHYQLDLNLLKNNLRSFTKVEGKINEAQIQGRVTSELKGIRKEIKKVSIQNCFFDLKRLEQNKHRGEFNLDCPVRIDLTPLQLPSATYTKYITIPDQLDFLIKTNFETSFYPNFDQSINGGLFINLKPISQKLIVLDGNFNTAFQGIPSQYPKDWKMNSDIKMTVFVPHVEKIIDLIKQTAWAVPAPLNIMKGGVELGVAGKIDITKKIGNFPIYFKTALNSKNQNFNLNGNGELHYEFFNQPSNSDLLFELQLSSLKLELPNLEFTSALPQFFPDSRIDPVFSSRSKNKSDFALNYHVKIYTLPDKPVLLLSNLTKTPIPIDLNVFAEKDKLTGTVEIGETDLNFFRRNAKIQRLKINLENPRSESELNGAVEVALSDYLIRIILLGTIEKPQVVFRSEPPLSEEQLMSVLIYGRTFDELDTNNASSVGSFSAALADRAISLASLYILASTPIESIGYNPQTRAFLAKIKLAKGTSLSLGSEWGKSEQIGVNRKIGRRWFLKTYFENDHQTNKQSGGAALEWSKRY